VPTIAATLDKQRGMLRRGQVIVSDMEAHSAADLELSHREALQGIASNLVSNASKYSEEGTTIEVLLRRRDGIHWTLQVKDQGVGIEASEQAAIFNRFFRCDKTSHIPGTGVGLDLVQQYVSSLDGSISVESSPGNGSTFTVTWPIGEPPQV